MAKKWDGAAAEDLKQSVYKYKHEMYSLLSDLLNAEKILIGAFRSDAAMGSHIMSLDGSRKKIKKLLEDLDPKVIEPLERMIERMEEYENER